MSTKQTSFHLHSVIRLNVGGQRFDTTLRTLLADRHCDLFPIFAGFLEKEGCRLPPRDLDGAYFLDRDPDQFRLLLNTLRYLVELQEKQPLVAKSVETLNDDGASTKSTGFWNRLRRKG